MPTFIRPEEVTVTPGGDSGAGWLLAAAAAAAVCGVAAVAVLAVWRFAAAHALVLILGGAGAAALTGGGVWALHRWLTVAYWAPEADGIIARAKAAELRRLGLSPEPPAGEEPEPEPEPAVPAPWPGLRLVTGGDDSAA